MPRSEQPTAAFVVSAHRCSSRRVPLAGNLLEPELGTGCVTVKRLMARSSTVGRHLKRRADLSHPRVAEATKPLDEQPDRDRFDGVEVDRASTLNRVLHRLEHDLAGEPSDGRRARRHQCPTKPMNRSVSRQHDNGSAADTRRLAPPQLATTRKIGHRPAASRKDARSPHSSGSSRGCST